MKNDIMMNTSLREGGIESYCGRFWSVQSHGGRWSKCVIHHNGEISWKPKIIFIFLKQGCDQEKHGKALWILRPNYSKPDPWYSLV